MRHKSTDPYSVRLHVDFSQPGNCLQIDEIRIIESALLHQNHQRRPAAERARIVTVPSEHCHRLRQGTRLQKVEGSDRHDDNIAANLLGRAKSSYPCELRSDIAPDAKTVL